jgi:hypothetical protein
MWPAAPLAAPLPTAVPVTDAELRTKVEDATLGAEVIVAQVVDFVKLPTLPVEEISDLVVAAASLKALKDARPAVIWTGVPYAYFSLLLLSL